MTQKELSQKVGVALDTISRYEQGKREPKAACLYKIAKELGRTVEELLSPP